MTGRTILVTGGAGFIGSCAVRQLVKSGHRVVNVDKLTYSANLESLRTVSEGPQYRFVQADICDQERITGLLAEEQVSAVLHLAAETHVDRSIDSPEVFIQSNVVGTVRLLQAALDHWSRLDDAERKGFRFHHVSTDEVYGDLPYNSGSFTEDSLYKPSSPYAASKAASDHFVKAWHATYGLPIVISNCSNNYGPFHFPEKLIPLTIINGLEGERLPVYGRGENVRDWLHVEDHARALELILTRGRVGESYNVGARAECSNLALVETICDLLDERRPLPGGGNRRSLIEFVDDRPGHDRRYSVDPTKIKTELGWAPEQTLQAGLAQTVDWYIDNEWWWRPIREARYGGERLGTGPANLRRRPNRPARP